LCRRARVFSRTISIRASSGSSDDVSTHTSAALFPRSASFARSIVGRKVANRAKSGLGVVGVIVGGVPVPARDVASLDARVRSITNGFAGSSFISNRSRGRASDDGLMSGRGDE